ncbi:MAG: 30S ribosomal protein S8e [Candidatus Micrarchaeia archaeon]
MEEFHGRSGRKSSGTGGRIKKHRDKRLFEIGGVFTATKVGDSDARFVSRTRGGGTKVRLRQASFVNVVTKDGIKRAKIRTVLETPDNRHYARQNIITKGTILDTEFGKVRVTNRVGQDGVINGVLV